MINKLQGKDYLSDVQILDVMKYKNVQEHTNQKVSNFTAIAFASSSIEKKIQFLKKLNGVGMTVASTILMFHNPYKFGELNHTVWNILHRNYGLSGSEKSSNSDYSIPEYVQYIQILQSLSEEYGMRPSDIVFIISTLKK